MCESRSLNVSVGALCGWHVYRFMRNGSFSTIGHMVNIILIQEIDTEEIYSGYTRGGYWFISWKPTSGFDNFQTQDITAIEFPI